MYEEFDSVWITEPKKQIGNALYANRITLSELYRRGWWITEIFGSYATVVSESIYHRRHNSYEHGRPYFCCKQCQIDINAVTPRIARRIKAISESKWQRYKHIMLRQKKPTDDRRYS